MFKENSLSLDHQQPAGLRAQKKIVECIGLAADRVGEPVKMLMLIGQGKGLRRPRDDLVGQQMVDLIKPDRWLLCPGSTG